MEAKISAFSGTFERGVNPFSFVAVNYMLPNLSEIIDANKMGS
jgi:hypothetical protein